MSEELLLEIGTEEIPAAFMPAALASLKKQLGDELKAARIGFADIRTYGTPRRLVLTAYGVADRQKDLVVTKTGPAKKIAYDTDGNPTKAAQGFARGQGIDVDQLTVVETDKGSYICAEKHEQGVATAELLPEMLPRVISSLPFPKSMRWGDGDLRFARPIHWIVALFGGREMSFSLGGIASGSTTFGHRFMAPAGIAVNGIESYLDAMKKAHVVIDPEKRRQIITEQIHALAQTVGGVPDADQNLLEEVTHILESPFPVLCSFDDDFLHLPGEVLLTTMKKHQKYFPVLNTEGSPLAYFIAVNNTDTVDRQVVVSGHERVLRARLADARFFFTEDCKRQLASMADELKQVVFQAKLGTSFEKVMRFQKLALFIAETFINPALKPTVKKAAGLCKADLVSEMVGEFPELQGTMGREYARLSGEPDAVSQAIFEHYLPRFAGDDLPATDAGAVVSMADKLDTIAGCFGIGLVPSGTADPYALRRQCLGIINIILEKRYAVSLVRVVRESVSLLGDKLTRSAEETCADVISFFSGRLLNLLTGRGVPHDVVDAVLARGVDNLADTMSRIDALGRMKQDPDFEALAASFKRVVNILAGRASHSIDPSLFDCSQERDLYQKYLSIRDQVKERMAQKAYLDALKIVATVREPVDGFFDNVLVMAEDESVRENRLALLHEISSLFTNFADFSRIASE